MVRKVENSSKKYYFLILDFFDFFPLCTVFNTASSAAHQIPLCSDFGIDNQTL